MKTWQALRGIERIKLVLIEFRFSIDHDSFSAEVIARKMAPHPHKIELGFKYSRGTATDSPWTLYKMWIAVA